MQEAPSVPPPAFSSFSIGCNPQSKELYQRLQAAHPNTKRPVRKGLWHRAVSGIHLEKQQIRLL